MTLDLQAFIDGNIGNAEKEIAKYQARIENAPRVVHAELLEEYGPQIEALQAEVDAMRDERDRANARMEKLGVAVFSGVPLKNAAMFAELIQGDNLHEYKADAERLLEMFRKV